jgi:hypothetical protein
MGVDRSRQSAEICKGALERNAGETGVIVATERSAGYRITVWWLSGVSQFSMLGTAYDSLDGGLDYRETFPHTT